MNVRLPPPARNQSTRATSVASIRLVRRPFFYNFIKAALLVCFYGLSGLLHVQADTDYSACFVPGEVSTYQASWMGIPLVWSEHTTSAFEENGRQLIRLRMISRNYKAYSYIYKVDNVTEVILDPKTALPIRLDVILNEGTIHKSNHTTFYHEKKMAVYQDRISNETREVSIESRSQDVYSFLYSARNRDLESMAARKHTLLVDGKLYDLRLNILKEEKISLSEYGKIACIKIEPQAEFDGLFLRRGKVLFWISKHKHRMITCIEAKVAVGKIKVNLNEVTGSGYDFWDQER